MLNGHNPQRAVSALQSIPNNLSGSDWLRPSMAAKAAGVPFDEWHSWCQGASNYKGEADCRARWKSFDPDGPVQDGTLFGMARDHGWQDDTATPRPAPARPARTPEPPRKPAPGASAAEVWARCEPATAGHAYIVAKQGNPESLRVVPAGDRLTIAGQSVAGWLAVPAYAPDGSMQSIQFIPPPGIGKKLNLPGASMAAASFTLGTDGPVYLCEGIGATWSAWQSTGHRAVCCFGWGNLSKIAAQLRQRDPDAKLVVCPDVGKEAAAAEIAALHQCAVAPMPTGWPDNSDINDVFCSPEAGFDVVAALLEGAANPPKPVPDTHPLARFVDFDGVMRPPSWVIPGFIPTGVISIAGAPGVGKTTGLLPLALTAAGLHGDELMPAHWRHVIYVTEDVDQANRILTGMVNHSDLGITVEAVRERLHVVSAIRLDPTFVVSAGKIYRELFTRTVKGVAVLPLVVLDTKSAVMALDNENDNAEASRMMAALKQGFDGLPVWLVGHVAKANLGRTDVAGLSARGAGSVDGDGNQTMYLVQEGDVRYLVLGKVRFEPKWRELEILSYSAQTTAPDEFGNLETIVLRWGIARPPQQSRKEAAEQAADDQRQKDEADLRTDIRDAVEVAWLAGNPLNREGIKSKLGRKAQTVLATVENLLNERWIHEVFIPAKERLHPRKSAFFVNLSTKEHEDVLSGVGLPADKLVIPQSWKKEPVSIIPDAGNDWPIQGEVRQ